MQGAAAVLCLCSASAAFADRPAPDLKAGKAAYEQSCARCHGLAGHGDGVDARRFYPRPRDFNLGVYKFRSTVSGTPPTDEDLFRTITQGLPGSNMPDWQHLDETVRWQIVAYLKTLSPLFEKTPSSPVHVTGDPGLERADRAKGKALYEKLGCAACHGASGRANGMSAAGLVDDWGMPIRPANLVQGWSYRGGSDPRSIMLRVLTGIDGAGMPSYAEAMSPEEAWQLAYYVTSLQETPRWHQIAHVARMEGALPTTAEDPRWALAERTDVRLHNTVEPDGTWRWPPTVKAVSFQAVTNGDAIAFRFEWHDPTQETKHAHDGFAVALKPAGAQGDTVTLQAWPYEGAPQLDLCYWAADTGQTIETLAREFNSVIARADPQPIALPSAARYDDGRWQLVLERPLHPRNMEGAAVLSTETLPSIAFAVWDGGNPEARAISSWVDLDLRQSATQQGGSK